jgi:hypothetical protein
MSLEAYLLCFCNDSGELGDFFLGGARGLLYLPVALFFPGDVCLQLLALLVCPFSAQALLRDLLIQFCAIML